MTTQALQPSLAHEQSEDSFRPKLRAAVLALFAVMLVFDLYLASKDLLAGTTQYPGFWLFLARYDFLADFIMLLAVWRRLESPASRIPLGFAFGYAANAIFLITQSFIGPLQGPLFLLPYRLLLLILYIAVAVFSGRIIQGLKSRRALALAAMPVGWFFSAAVTEVMKTVTGVLKFIHGGY